MATASDYVDWGTSTRGFSSVGADERALLSRALGSSLDEVEPDKSRHDELFIALVEIYWHCKATVRGALPHGFSALGIHTLFGGSLTSRRLNSEGQPSTAAVKALNALRRALARILAKFGIGIEEQSYDSGARHYWCFVELPSPASPNELLHVEFMNATEFFPAVKKWVQEETKWICPAFFESGLILYRGQPHRSAIDELLTDIINAKLKAASIPYEFSLHIMGSSNSGRSYIMAYMQFIRVKQSFLSAAKAKVMLHAQSQKRQLDEEAEIARKKRETEDQLRSEIEERHRVFCELSPDSDLSGSVRTQFLNAMDAIYKHCCDFVDGELDPSKSPVGIAAPLPLSCHGEVMGPGNMKFYYIERTHNYVAFLVKMALVKLGLAMRVVEVAGSVYWLFSKRGHPWPSSTEPLLEILNGEEYGAALEKWTDERINAVLTQWAFAVDKDREPSIPCEDCDKLLVHLINDELCRQEIPCTVAYQPHTRYSMPGEKASFKFTVDCSLVKTS